MLCLVSPLTKMCENFKKFEVFLEFLIFSILDHYSKKKNRIFKKCFIYKIPSWSNYPIFGGIIRSSELFHYRKKWWQKIDKNTSIHLYCYAQNLKTEVFVHVTCINFTRLSTFKVYNISIARITYYTIWIISA